MNREKVAEALYYQHHSTKWGDVWLSIRERYRGDADQIIALIVDEDAELPDNPFLPGTSEHEAYWEGQSVLKIQGWRKVRE